MTDRFSEAVREMEKKSPFICASCGHPNEIASKGGRSAGTPDMVKDRFSEAVKESGEKSAFICESCGHQQSVTTSRH